jgi:Ca2+-binding EF-hand superfamily protein
VTLLAFFNDFDDEGDGYLAHNEFAVMVASLEDIEMDNEQLRAVIKSIDTDGGGFIDFPEFEGAMKRHQQVTV